MYVQYMLHVFTFNVSLMVCYHSLTYIKTRVNIRISVVQYTSFNLLCGDCCLDQTGPNGYSYTLAVSSHIYSNIYFVSNKLSLCRSTAYKTLWMPANSPIWQTSDEMSTLRYLVHHPLCSSENQKVFWILMWMQETASRTSFVHDS
jgi:hypothetical protein